MKAAVERTVRWRVIDAPVAQWTQLEVASQEVALWWLGQAGFLIRSSRLCLMIDPYLSDSLALKYRGREFPHVRLMPPPLAPAVVRGVGLVLCTHAHTDHMDPGTLPLVAHSSPECRFVVPRAVQATAIARGVPAASLIAMNDGEAVAPLAGLEVEAIASAHEDVEIDARGDHRYLGYVLRLAGTVLYHSGDCVPFPGLDERLEGRGVDVALLPVNGRDEYRRARGVPGNFRLDEALALAERHGMPLLVSHHFGLFDFNTVDPAMLEAQARRPGKTRLLVPRIDRALIVSAAS